VCVFTIYLYVPISIFIDIYIYEMWCIKAHLLHQTERVLVEDLPYLYVYV